MPNQCSLCLSCGAPFVPVAQDMLMYDRVGNISVMFLQKLVSNNESLKKSVEHPNFCSKPHDAHVLHRAHHRWAVELMIRELLVGEAHDRQKIPFVRAPGGKSSTALIAKWDEVDTNDTLDLKYLSGFLEKLKPHKDAVDILSDFDLTVLCCDDCNYVMTGRFWFNYHLWIGSRRNPSALIPDETITVYTVNTASVGRKDSVIETSTWQDSGVIDGTYPHADYDGKKEILTAALIYYLRELCRPSESLESSGVDHVSLYYYLCWLVLEVTCLLCEYHRGSRDMENSSSTKKRQRCRKNQLGCIELYFSFFCWLVGGFQYNNVQDLGFTHWHQIYMWHARGCWDLFPSKQGASGDLLIADMLTPKNMDAGSKTLVKKVAKRMTRVLKNNIMKLIEFVGKGKHKKELGAYFLPSKYRRRVFNKMMIGVEPDFDSFAMNVGIDVMLSRVIALSRDFDKDIKGKLSSFLGAWRRAEIQNVARASGRGEGALEAAKVLYTLCKLLHPPTLEEWTRMTRMEARETLMGPKCSPWAAVLALDEIGAFDSTSPEDQALLLEDQ